MALTQPRRSSDTLKLVFCVVVIPLVLLLCGAWQDLRRPSPEQIQDEVARIEANMERLRPRASDPLFFVQTKNDEIIKASEALNRLQAYHDTLVGTNILGEALPRWLNFVELPLAVLALLIGAAGLIYIRMLGRRARRSREDLLTSFDAGRRFLPWLLGGFSISVFGALFCVLGFELSRFVWQGVSNSSDAKVVLCGLFAVGSTCMICQRSLRNLLRAARATFVPKSVMVTGRSLRRDEAPDLWGYIDGIADGLQARKPDAIIVGMDDGFFVTEVQVCLASGETVPPGRVLYLPLPYMAYLDRQEVAAIIGHELGHFSGDDTRYSLQFAPIYASACNSLGAVTAASDDASLQKFNPVVMLGEFFLYAFHEAVQHWSRVRELSADQFGARGPGQKAMASALLRTCALAPRVQQALDLYKKNMTRNVLVRTRRLIDAYGVDDPLSRLDYAQPHPTDSHPPLVQRLAALNVPTPSAEMLARARETSGSALMAELGLNADTNSALPGATASAASTSKTA